MLQAQWHTPGRPRGMRQMQMEQCSSTDGEQAIKQVQLNEGTAQINHATAAVNGSKAQCRSQEGREPQGRAEASNNGPNSNSQVNRRLEQPQGNVLEM